MNIGDKKNECHKWFDKLWRNTEERSKCYEELAERMGMTREQCHFALLADDELDKALVIVKQMWWEKFDK